MYILQLNYVLPDIFKKQYYFEFKHFEHIKFFHCNVHDQIVNGRSKYQYRIDPELRKKKRFLVNTKWTLHDVHRQIIRHRSVPHARVHLNCLYAPPPYAEQFVNFLTFGILTA